MPEKELRAATVRLDDVADLLAWYIEQWDRRANGLEPVPRPVATGRT